MCHGHSVATSGQQITGSLLHREIRTADTLRLCFLSCCQIFHRQIPLSIFSGSHLPRLLLSETLFWFYKRGTFYRDFAFTFLILIFIHGQNVCCSLMSNKFNASIVNILSHGSYKNEWMLGWRSMWTLQNNGIGPLGVHHQTIKDCKRPLIKKNTFSL